MSEVISMITDRASISDVIASIAVIIAAIALWNSRHIGNVQKRLVELEEKRELDRERVASKAELYATLEKYGRLVIENNGNCEARNIILQMDETPPADRLIGTDDEGLIRIIGSRSQVTIYVKEFREKALGSGLSFELGATWEDDSGEPGRYRTTLTC